MQHKSSQATAVSAGFVLCLFLICVVSGTAYYALEMCERERHYTQQISENQVLCGQTFRQFDAAQIAALHFRETNDPEFVKAINQLLNEAMECLETMYTQSISAENRARGMMLMDLFMAFRQVCEHDADICKQIELIKKKEEPEREKELTAMYDAQRQIRAKQDEIAAEVNKSGMELREVLEKILHEITFEADAASAQLRTILVTTSILSVILGLVICFVVVSLVRRDPAPVETDYGTIEGSEPTGDLRLVADRLQEVVNLLRK